MDQRRSKIRVEKVYANSYHQNLLLNLPKVLQMNKQITNISLRRLKPQTESYTLQWEDYNGVFLPNDVKDFYLAHDGFLFLWTFNPMPEGSPVQCGININCLNDLDAIAGYEVSTKAGISMKNGRKVLALSTNSRIFELEPLGEGNQTCVCLVYYNVWLRPTVWLWSKPNGFFFLSKDFTTYFRMCLAHLGIIGWQYTFTTMVLPKWTRRIMRKIAPHLLRSPDDYTLPSQELTYSRKQTSCKDNKNSNLRDQVARNVVPERCISCKNTQQQDEEVMINKLDANVFVNTVCPIWPNSNLDQLNMGKCRPLSIVSNGNVRSIAASKKGKSTGKKPNLRPTSAYYNKRYVVSPKVDMRRSKYDCKK